MKLKAVLNKTIFFRPATGRPIFFLIFIICCSYNAYAQTEVANTLQRQFEQYRSQSIQEKVYARTDKSFYVTGETVWFKLYNVDGYFNRPSDISKLAYVEIIDNSNKSILQAKIELKEGSGSGSFVLPTSIQSGNYKLRAYTNWMKNFSPDYFFEKSIAIVNTMKTPVWQTISDKPVSYDIQFFPEGGNLVEGIKSRVAFRAVNQYGKGIECSGVLFNQKNDTVARFQSLRFGMGQFEFTPVQGDVYTAMIIPAAGGTVTPKFPSVYKEGYVMRLSSVNDRQLEITVSSNIPSVFNQPVYVFVHTRQLVKLVQEKMLNGGHAVFTIDKSSLDEGVSQITVFNNSKQPVCERLYFTPPVKKLALDVKTDQPEYSTRKKVSIDVTTQNQLGKQEEAGLSMSVFLLDSLQSLEQGDITSYLWLTSDLKGNIESPSYYFSSTGSEAEQALDNLLLTQGWRRFRWEDVLKNSKPSFDFLPEFEGHIINAKILDKKTGQPVAGVNTWLSVPAKRYKLNSAVSNRDGMARFIVKDFFGKDEMILQANKDADSNYRIDVMNPFAESFSDKQLPLFNLPEAWKNQLVSHSIGAQVQNSYQIDKKNQFALPDVFDTTMFYGKPDKKYFLDDYTRFSTMEEVMREYIVDVHVRKRNDKFHFDVENSPYKVFFDSDPLTLLDGVPVFDLDKIIAMDPLKVKKIEIVARKYYLGSLVLNGIVSYSTYEGDLEGYQLDPNSIVIEYQGMQLQREFYSPVYETPSQTESRLPDFRNLLYWSPSVKTDETGKTRISFYTSDMPGKYAVLIEGMTAEGLAGSQVKSFIVK